MAIRSKMRTNSKSKRRTLKSKRRSIKRQRGGDSRHGTKCSEDERKEIISDRNQLLICKKSKQIFGKKVKSSLKKKNGTRSLGKYGKTLNSEECMKGPCWHKLSMKDRIMYKSKIKEARKEAKAEAETQPAPTNVNCEGVLNSKIKRGKGKRKKCTTCGGFVKEINGQLTCLPR